MTELDVANALFIDWLNRSRGSGFALTARDGASAVATDGGATIAIEVHPLVALDDRQWLAARDRLAGHIAGALPGGYAIWVPIGASLPSEEPGLSVFIDLVRRSALKLGPNERSYIPLPVKLYLRRTADEGNVVSVTGALNPYWARFTERVRGTYDLDSTRLYRLPESDSHLADLLDSIVEATGSLSSGSTIDIETIDAWTVQRLPEDGVAVIGVAPLADVDLGQSVRRNFRRILSGACPRLREREAGLRALVLLGPYARMEHEGATTALRGYDPALYAGIDFICLVADGLVKPLIQPSSARQGI